MSRKTLWLMVVALLIASLVPLVGVSAQFPPYIDFTSIDYAACTPGEAPIASFVYGYPGSEIPNYHHWTLTNTRTGDFSAWDVYLEAVGEFVLDLYEFSEVPVPAGTTDGDTLVFRVELREDYGEGFEILDFDQRSWTCGGEVEPLVVPGCDVTFPIPSDAVVGSFVSDAPTFYEPGKLIINPTVTIGAENTAWVLGKDESGAYYKIIWVCQYLWVEVGTMGPNYDEVWNGTPLPQGTVE